MENTMKLSRRSLMAGTGALLGLAGLGMSPRVAFAQETVLRAAITGYGGVEYA
ncbi:hypothetical protein HGG72_25255 [Ochrobactrum pecoris]|nr:hypothetical protein [Brucella pecoris]